MANTGNSDKWYFTKEQLENTPSRKCGYDSFKELSYRQQAANFIQDMGQRLKVSQLCINTAIVYMHRFYVFHSFTHFPWHQMAAAALFLAAKVEEQPRKLEYVIRISNICRNPRDTAFDVTSERYLAQSQDLVFNENVLLQTLGFDVAIDHPHTHVVRCCHLVRASKDLAQTSYFMASNSLHLTTMCLQYKPTVVACFCILVACKWSNWEIPLSNEKKEWYSYVDPTVTAELLQQLTEEFLVIFENCPSRLKEKIMAVDSGHNLTSHINSPFDQEPRKIDPKEGGYHRPQEVKSDHDPHKHRSSRPHDGSSSRPHEAGSSRSHESSTSQQQREREYREKKERERLAQQHGQKPVIGAQPVKVPHSHHRPPVDHKMKPHPRPPMPGYPSTSRSEPRDILREAARDSPFGLANVNKDYRDPPREHTKDASVRDPQVRSDKDVQKRERDYLLKPNASETNSVNSYSTGTNYSADKQRVDPNRPRVDPGKVIQKHDSARRREEVKPYLKTETESIKKHLSASVHDKNSGAYLNKSTNSTSQKPFSVDTSKSVPKPNVGQPSSAVKPHHYNGSSNGGGYNVPVLEDDRIKQEIVVKEEVRSPIIRKPSLFSPEQTPQEIKKEVKIEHVPGAEPLSPLGSPINGKRSRFDSSSSEPELRPVMKKIDQVEGFENLMRDSTIGINKMRQVPDIITPIADIKKEDSDKRKFSHEMKPPDIIPPLNCDNNAPQRPTIVNGLETNPTVISNLLKEAPAVPHLPAVSASTSSSSIVAETQPQAAQETKEHHHHKSKKKNKDKHKHKDKDRSRDDKEKKKKHKDKDREKHKHKHKEEAPPESAPAEPIKIKIQMDKVQPVLQAQPQNSGGLKIKIPRDKIKTETIEESPGSFKIKISRDVLNKCAPAASTSTSSSSSDKKREWDGSPGDAPPAKISKSSYKESKQNGRHSYSSKVAHMGDGESSLHRLAESKYIIKGTSSSC